MPVSVHGDLNGTVPQLLVFSLQELVTRSTLNDPAVATVPTKILRVPLATIEPVTEEGMPERSNRTKVVAPELSTSKVVAVPKFLVGELVSV